MGTRNLEVVVLNGEVRVAQYCQFDGYPDGQGLTALSFVRDQMNRELFTQRLLQSAWITPEEHKQLWVDCGASPDSDMVEWSVSEKFKEVNPHLHRNTGANIFELIQNSTNGLKLQDSLSFAADSLFCEWAYVIDFDKNTFEVYSGFNKNPLPDTERFAHLQEAGSEYSPISLVKSYSLKDLPTDEQFLEDLKQKEDSDEE